MIARRCYSVYLDPQLVVLTIFACSGLRSSARLQMHFPNAHERWPYMRDRSSAFPRRAIDFMRIAA